MNFSIAASSTGSLTVFPFLVVSLVTVLASYQLLRARFPAPFRWWVYLSGLDKASPEGAVLEVMSS